MSSPDVPFEAQAAGAQDLETQNEEPSLGLETAPDEKAPPLPLDSTLPMDEIQAQQPPPPLSEQTVSEEVAETLPPASEERDTLPTSSKPINDEVSLSIHELSNELTCPTNITVPHRPAEDLLLFPVNESAYVRLATTSALIGALRTQKVMRRLHGEDAQTRLGGQAPLTRLIGKGAALIFTGASHSKLLKLEEDELFLMEDTVLRFHPM
jgi:hypothetical protein